MEIRVLQMPELLPALHLVWEVFEEEIAPAYKPEGIESFRKFIHYDYISQVWQRGNLIFLGAYDNEELCGTLAIRPDGHIALFFVKKERQGRGIGRMLFQTAYQMCRYQLGVNKMTVHAAPKAAEKYRHLGMRAVSDLCEADGICYIPMEMYVNGDMPAHQKKRSNVPWIALGAFAVILVFVMAACAVISRDVIRARVQDGWDAYGYRGGDSGDDGEGWGSYEGDEDGEEADENSGGNLTGISAIQEYIAGDLPYEIENDEYIYSGEGMQSAMIEFSVSYPKITGLADEETENAVNEALRNTARETVVRIYEDPSQEIKERVLSEGNPLLINYVSYKICYASEEILSVAFDDNAYEGGQNYYAQHLRTCNINLKDGKVYEVKDIVKLSDDFMAKWLETMRQEAGNPDFLSELDLETIRKTLEGDSQNGVYVTNFFLHKGGIEIGYDLNYAADDPNDLKFVWVTAPFTFDELEDYASDSDFWKYIRK